MDIKNTKLYMNKMAMAYLPFTTWCTGFLNGYKHKEQGLPDSIVYSLLGTSTALGMMKSIGIIDTMPKPIKPMPVLIGFFVIVPAMTYATYFLGGQLGQAMRYVEDLKEGVSIKLL